MASNTPPAQPVSPSAPTYRATAADLERLRRRISRFDLAGHLPTRAPDRPMHAAVCPPTDSALVAGALAGDHRAFHDLISRHRDAVRAAVSHRIRDRDAVDDLVQEALLRAFVRLGTLRDGSRFRPWVLQIARNVALDALRHRARAAMPAAVDVDDVLADDVDEPPAVFELKQLQERMRSGLARLSERDRAALTLVSDGCGPAEVAGELGVTAATAKVVVHRARRRLLAAIA